jgi:type IV pilus assembly protein PilX
MRTTNMQHRNARPAAQRGVVLIIALVMLVVISLLTTLSIRSAVSTESVSGNVRTTELATQAAEIALRYCEQSVVQIASGTVTFTVTPTILTYDSTTFPRWKSTSGTWDVSPSDAFVIPTAYVNQGAGPVTYKRRPECLVERMAVVTPAGALSTTSTYVITARGFGPEVPDANSARSRPQGTEVWMQSTIEIQ